MGNWRDHASFECVSHSRSTTIADEYSCRLFFRQQLCALELVRTGSADRLSPLIRRSLQYDFYFSTSPQNNPGQCSSMSISWDSKVQAPIGLYGLVPSGTAFEVSIPQGSPYSTSWTVDIAQGTQFLLLMADNGPHQTGGSTNLLTVGGGDSSCLSGSSPKTGNTASASSTVASSSSTAASSTSGSAASASSVAISASSSSGTTSASSLTGTGSSSAIASASAGAVAGQGGSSSGGDNTATGQTGGSSSNNLGAIIGGAVGGVVALALLALLLFCCLRRRRSTRRDSTSLPVNRDYAVAPVPMAEKSRRGRGFNRMSMAGRAATGRRADTDDETGGMTTDDESVIGHPVDVRDPQYQASPFTGSQPPALSSGEGYNHSSYSAVPAHHEDEWGAGVLAAAGFEPEKQRLSQEYYSPRTGVHPTLPVPPTMPDPSRRSASETGSPVSLGRSSSTRKPPLPRTPVVSPTALQDSDTETRYVQHEDAGQVV